MVAVPACCRRCVVFVSSVIVTMEVTNGAAPELNQCNQEQQRKLGIPKVTAVRSNPENLSEKHPGHTPLAGGPHDPPQHLQ